MKLRSLLYVPADNARFVQKAHLRGADGIILDLEDSVVAQNKRLARDGLAASVASAGQNGAQVFVRLNSPPDAAELDAAAALSAKAHGLYVSKASSRSLARLDKFLSTLETGSTREPMPFIAMIEDAASLLAVADIAAQKRVIALTVGGEDMANDLGAQPDADVLKLPKQMVHFAAKSKGLLSFGTFRSVANYTDLDAIRVAAAAAKRYGFDGASCVHPQVVPVLNAAFEPSDTEIIWAKAVLDIHAKTGAGSFSFEGMMIDEPVLARARRILQSN